VEEVKQEDPVVQEYLGVEQVIKLALQAKKPLVAHNMIYDLLFLYEQFIGELPPSYSEFKLLARLNASSLRHQVHPSAD
jgi:hypothetical protein